MAETVTIARPYAEAVFRLAKEQSKLSEWSKMLGYAAAIAGDPQMQACFADPKIKAADLEALFLSVGGDALDEQGKNFIKELVHNDRLSVLPEIAELYEALKAQQGGVLEAKVESAYPMNASQIEELVKKLEAKFNKKVDARVDVNPELIGGVKIEIGDDVIDASVRGKLQAMAFALTR